MPLVERRRAWWGELSTSRQLLVLGVVSLALFFLRRPLQFIHPDVWVEDGTILIPDTMRFGVDAVFRPQNGYLFVVPRVLNLVSMQVPIEYYPELSTLLAVLFDLSVVLCVAAAPTVLRARSLCALAVMLIPVDPEVYALNSYTFWFAALLPVLALLWHPDHHSRTDTVARIVAIVVGGLSSPISVIVLPLFLVRALIVRTARETLCLAVAALTASLQIIHILPRNARSATGSFDGLIELVVAKFFGFYLFSPAGRTVAVLSGVVLGAIVIAYFIVVASRMQDGEERIRMLLFLLLPLVIGASIVRAPVTLINPLDGGPRYFFLPYICISWIRLNPPSGRPLLAGAGAIALVLSVLNGASHFVRLQDPTDWKGAAREYRESGRAVFPVQFTGEGGTWQVELPPVPEDPPGE